MAGSVLTVGALACTAALTWGIAVSAAAAAVSQQAAGAADAAALAAADAVSGAVPAAVPGEDPCALAAVVAARNGARLTACAVDGFVATVRVVIPFGLLAAEARARAGPAPSTEAPPAPPPDAPTRSGGE